MKGGWIRGSVYLLAVPLVVWGAAEVGEWNYERVWCGPGRLDPEDCWAFMSAWEWGATALLVSVAAAVLVEVVIRRASRS